MRRYPLITCLMIILIGLCGLPIATHAMLITNAAEGVVFDDATGKYWMWDMSTYRNMTYEAQIDTIGDMSLFGLEDWRMATTTDMTALWAYTAEAIADAFNPTRTYPGVTISWDGRYDEFSLMRDGTPGHMVGAMFYDVADDELRRSDLGSTLTWDTLEHSIMGAWVVSDGSGAVIPEPNTLILLGSGMLGLLALRRKYTKKD